MDDIFIVTPATLYINRWPFTLSLLTPSLSDLPLSCLRLVHENHCLNLQSSGYTIFTSCGSLHFLILSLTGARLLDYSCRHLVPVVLLVSRRVVGACAYAVGGAWVRIGARC